MSLFNQLSKQFQKYLKEICSEPDELYLYRLRLMKNYEQEVISKVNAERRQRGLAPLKSNVLLRNAARSYAVELAKVPGRLSHTGLDGSMVDDRVKNTGYLDAFFDTENSLVRSYAVGENLARGQYTPFDAVAGWMGSPPHRAAILSSEFEETGVGVIGNCWVQVFGKIK